jgi:hypothetical protein
MWSSVALGRSFSSASRAVAAVVREYVGGPLEKYSLNAAKRAERNAENWEELALKEKKLGNLLAGDIYSTVGEVFRGRVSEEMREVLDYAFFSSPGAVTQGRLGVRARAARLDPARALRADLSCARWRFCAPRVGVRFLWENAIREVAAFSFAQMLSRCARFFLLRRCCREASTRPLLTAGCGAGWQYFRRRRFHMRRAPDEAREIMDRLVSGQVRRFLCRFCPSLSALLHCRCRCCYFRLALSPFRSLAPR